jgi:hypothetical protein
MPHNISFQRAIKKLRFFAIRRIRTLGEMSQNLNAVHLDSPDR